MLFHFITSAASRFTVTAVVPKFLFMKFLLLLNKYLKIRKLQDERTFPLCAQLSGS